VQVLQAVEQVKAWADFQGLAALRRLREAVGELVPGLGRLELDRGRPRADADLLVARVQHRDGRRDDAGHRLVRVRGHPAAPAGPGRGRARQRAAVRLASGDVSLDQALRIHGETRSLGAELARAHHLHTAAARRYETRRHVYHSALGQPDSEAKIVTAWEQDPPPF
jgi:hypothetical protein